MKRPICIFTILAFALLILPLTGHANILGNGDSGPPDLLPTPNGPMIATTGVLPFHTSTLQGTYFEEVFRDSSNVFCSGCLDFVIQFSNSSTSTDSIGRITNADFGSFMTDVGYISGSGGTPPDLVTRSFNGSVIGFDFFSGVLPGSSTPMLEIETNARSFTTGMLAVIDSTSENLTGFEPALVPEPASLFLLCTGLLTGGILGRKRYPIG